MADADILQHLIARPGQSQDERQARELAPDAAPVDARTPADLLGFTARLAAHVTFPLAGPLAQNPALTTHPEGWAPFFRGLGGTARADAERAARLLASEDGLTPPHLGLLLAFLKLYEVPRAALNRFSARHLDFYLRRVLGFARRGPVPDRAHVVVELKKQAPPAALTPPHRLSAGKDDKGVELLYAPVRETVVGAARVASLRSVYLDGTGRGTVRAAPVADSSDGVGGKLEGPEVHWPGFGTAALPAGTMGFALASPVLRMREGRRTVRLVLSVGGTDLTGLGAGALVDAFEIFLTGATGWLGPYGPASAAVAGGTLRLEFQVPEADDPVVDYDPALHGQRYATQAPVVQVLLRSGGTGPGYLDLKGVLVRRARIEVEVGGITTLTLESDAGRLDPKKAFLPFTAEPIARSRFMIGCEEAFAKKLSEVMVRLQWQGTPASFASHYANYHESVSDASFTASASIQDGGSWNQVIVGVPLFVTGSPGTERVMSFEPGGPSVSPPAPDAARVLALRLAGAAWARRTALATGLVRPMLWRLVPDPPAPRRGFLTLSLDRDFLHATYRRKSVEYALTYGKVANAALTVLNEPYTPRVQGISLDYRAHSDDVAIASNAEADFANADLQFFHAGCFGQMREHEHQRRRLGFVESPDVPLVPAVDHAGEFLIGLTGVGPGDSVSLLCQVAEGTADPDLPSEPVTWWVLCDNYWKRLGAGELTLDTTNGLLASGLIGVVLPAETTTEHTMLPPGMAWLRATVASSVESVCRLRTVAANAVEVRFRDGGNDPRRLSAPLAPGRIAKVRSGPAAVKSIAQPFASFGGAPEESEPALIRRASERLRHKNRCVTAWDYERMVLEQFPEVHRVKCVSHARDGVWLAPGHVLLVVILDLRGRMVRDPLRPKVDANTISRIRDFAQRHAGMQVQVDVRNPRYQPVETDFRVRFRPGYEFNYYSVQLHAELIRYLSPWAYDPGQVLGFGGHMFRSTLLAFVEAQPSVDYVTEFRMFSSTAGGGPDLNEALPETPDAILVSAARHTIRNAEQAAP